MNEEPPANAPPAEESDAGTGRRGLVALAKFAEEARLSPVDPTGKIPVRISEDLNETAASLATILASEDIFRQNGELVFFDSFGERMVMTPVRFRSWVNTKVIIYLRCAKDSPRPLPSMLTKDAAHTILENPDFLRRIRPLNGMNPVRLPVLRTSGELEYLPYGYDEETGIYTVDTGVQYDAGMDIEAAKGWMKRLYGWAPVTDERSFSVLVAGLLALYVRHLPGAESLRPGFVARGNKPGCGKSVIVKSWQYPVLGRAPAVKMKQGEQLDKEMEAFMIAGVPVIFLDNVYGSLKSATIDQMLTSEESEGRAMGGHGLFKAKNRAVLMISANNIEGNEDAERRFLLLDLFDPNDITERRPAEEDLLDDARMKTPAWRSLVLSICCAFVRQWHEGGMKRGSVMLQSFERYSWLLGGIVESAGYVNPFTRPEVQLSLNPDQAEFAGLLEGVLEEMAGETEKDFTIEALARIARRRAVYEREVGTIEQGRKLTIKEDKLTGPLLAMAEDCGYLTDSSRSMFGKKLKKRMGDNPIVRGRKLEFGKRYQVRKSTFTIKILS